VKGIGFRSLSRLESWATVVQRFGGWSPVLAAVVLEISHRCNLNCRMCPQAADRAARSQAGQVLDMPLNVLKHVVDDAARRPLYKPLVHLIGGEPLLHPQFAEAAAYVTGKGMRCSVTTNGTLLERYASQLVRLEVRDVRISLDGPEPVHNDIRGAAWVFARSVRGIESLLQARRESGARHPHVSINCVITGANYRQLGEVVDLAAQLGVDSLGLQHLMFADGTEHGLDIEYLLRALPGLQRQGERSGLPVSVYPKLSAPQIRRYYGEPSTSFGGTCVLPWFVVRVLPDGAVTPCRGFVIGRATDEGFSLSKAWNGPAIRNYRQRIAAHGLFADCDRCCHRLYPDGAS